MVETKYSRAAGLLGNGKQLGLAAGLILLANAVTVVIALAITNAAGYLRPTTIIGMISGGVGMTLVGGVYLWRTDRGIEYADLAVPTPRSVSLGLGLGVVIFSVQAALDFGARLAGVPMGFDQVAMQVIGDPRLFVTAAVLHFLVVGPSEEFFFRNVVQKRLTERFSAAGSIIAVSLLFAPLHIANFGGESTVAILVSLTGVFLASVLYGTAFEKWRRLDIIAIAHGVNNVVTLVVISIMA
ncbi:CPBP family intramembrane glutamic endopeptidase [Halorussus ruber]|uniref:CPBP family intramembrane glutamic endopeptidase n=1 Tax=Halorussus ruber TaxID=1126238 RepID=UPI001092D895|nr:type II CAAX endopeptidase family protein [Halorussus ruber]